MPTIRGLNYEHVASMAEEFGSIYSQAQEHALCVFFRFWLAFERGAVANCCTVYSWVTMGG